ERERTGLSGDRSAHSAVVSECTQPHGTDFRGPSNRDRRRYRYRLPVEPDQTDVQRREETAGSERHARVRHRDHGVDRRAAGQAPEAADRLHTLVPEPFFSLWRTHGDAHADGTKNLG